MSDKTAPRFPAPTKPYPHPSCICKRTWEPDVPGTTKRFGSWKITEYSKDCLDHGHMFSTYGLAAALRWDLPLGTR